MCAQTFMCARGFRFKHLAAPTAAAALAALLSATPASAGLFGSKPKPAAAVAAAPATPAAAPAAKAQAKPARKSSPEDRAAADRFDPLARAAFWGREFQADPTDAEAGVALSKALRAMEQYEEAIKVSGQVLVISPKSIPALLENARALVGVGRPFYAIDPLNRAKALAPKDWRPISMLAVVYELTERPDDALAAYQQALALSPDNPAVLANLALFYSARGDNAQAETLLRKAVAQPGASVQERQNLALVLGLQGKMAEAEKLMRQDLPPEIAANNLAYFRTPAAKQSAGAAAAGGSTRSWNTLEGAQSAPRR